MSLQVDDGTTRIIYPHSVVVGYRTYYEKILWCEDKFKRATWRYYDGCIYFRRKKDLNWFLLRWS